MSFPKSANPEVCIIGRLNFNTGIGAVCYAACEMLSRYFRVSIYPINSGSIVADYITLPNGRNIRVCKDMSEAKVFFFTDVLWNGVYDLNYTIVPAHGLRIAHVAYDSDLLPAEWVKVLNNHFDCVYFMSAHLEAVAAKSGVKIATGTLPCALDIEGLLSKPRVRGKDKVRFGSIAAFHPRKGVDILLDAFLEEFSGDENVELVLHSNLVVGNVFKDMQEKVRRAKALNVTFSNRDLPENEKTELVESFDIFANCSQGEGYSIGPREAMSLGKILVLSDIGPHQDLLGVAGTFGVDAMIAAPARYPEIDNGIFGRQYQVRKKDVKRQLRASYNYCVNQNSDGDVLARRRRAGEFSFSRLALCYAQTIVPDIVGFKNEDSASSFAHMSQACQDAANTKIGRFGHLLSDRNRVVLPAHDGGFFSVFNTLMSHLTWDMQDGNVHMVLPDWDVGRLVERLGHPVSFCYGRPEDGNIWLKLFKPLYGLSERQMNDRDFLYDKSPGPRPTFNEHREPLLTYIHAYDLYRSGNFGNFRRQYHKAFMQHVKLRSHFEAELNAFEGDNFADKFIVAAHVKHPSHIIEQPGKCIAQSQSFIDAIWDCLESRGYDRLGENWRVFLATDQDRVVAQFRQAFGDRVCYFQDVRRTRISEDELFDSLTSDQQAQEGFQVQHLVASNPDNWSTRMAWEVIRDAMVMSKAKVLFHVVSNVSTAVSYFNPEVEMVYLEH